MRRILSNQKLRRLSIVELLSNATGSMSYSQIATLMDSSERTIHDDIDVINQSATLFSITSTSKSVQIHYNTNQNIQTVYQHVLSDTAAFNIIEAIFSQGSVSLTYLTDTLDLSRSTLYRLIGKINPILLDRFNIEISFNPFAFVGSEVDIRYFLTQFVSERYLGETIPISLVDTDLLEKVMIEISTHINAVMNYTTLRIIKNTIIVNAIRLQQGYFYKDIAVQDEFIHSVMDISSPIYSQLKVFFDKLKIPFHSLYVSDLFTSFILKGYYYSPAEMKMAYDSDKSLQKSYTALDTLVSELSSNFNLALPNKDDLIYHLHSTAQLYKFEMNSNYILFDSKGLFVENLDTHYTAFVSSGITAIKDYLTIMGIEYHEEFVNHFFYKIFTHWKDLSHSLFNNIKKMTAVIFSAFDINHAKMLKSQLELQFANQIEFTVYEGSQLDCQTVVESNYDIIIANYPLPEIKDKHTVIIRSVPTSQDIASIMKIIALINASPNI